MRASYIALVSFLLSCGVSCAQERSAHSDPKRDENQYNICENGAWQHANPDSPNVRVVEVHFEDITEIPKPVLIDLAAKVKTEFTGENWFAEPCERIKAAYVDRGYFKALPRLSFEQVGGDSEHPQMALTISAGRPGIRYRLGTIEFKGAHLFNASRLRRLFLIEDGAIFYTARIRDGMESLRVAYLRRSYIDFVAMPDTLINNQDRSITLVIDIDEGKQYRLHSVAFAGVLPDMEREMKRWWAERIGKPFREEDFIRFHRLFRARMAYEILGPFEGTDVYRRESEASVDLEFNFGPSPRVYADGEVITPYAGRRR